MSQTVGGNTTNYLWDVASGLPVVLQETNREVLFRPSQNAVYRERSEFTYVYGLDLISVTDDEGAQRYFFTDGLGSVTSTIADDGTTASGYSYEAFGTPSTLSPSDRFLFTGEQYDAKARKAQAPAQSAETGLYYLRARMYNPEVGRMLAMDPILDASLAPWRQDPYGYAYNSPVTFADPSGMYVVDSSGDPIDEERECYSCGGGDPYEDAFDAVGSTPPPETSWATCQSCYERAYNVWFNRTISAARFLHDAGFNVNYLWWSWEQRREVAAIAAGLGYEEEVKTGLKAPSLDDIVEYLTGSGALALVGKVHSNSYASTQTTYLYQLTTRDGQHLKWGMTINTKTRYSQEFMAGKKINDRGSGTPRGRIGRVERWLVERFPGPLNREPWAGSKAWDTFQWFKK